MFHVFVRLYIRHVKIVPSVNMLLAWYSWASVSFFFFFFFVTGIMERVPSNSRTKFIWYWVKSQQLSKESFKLQLLGGAPLSKIIMMLNYHFHLFFYVVQYRTCVAYDECTITLLASVLSVSTTECSVKDHTLLCCRITFTSIV